MNIYVGNLDYKIDDQDLKEIFEEYGTVDSAKVISDRYSGKSKGFGFVEMENKEEAEKAIQELNEATIDNRKMLVNEARPRKEDSRS
ncbi:MAG: RNA-binding protein [Bacteroidales bacterium]